jgi:EAL domain-containing protein (putative c-di-GMP-specific phosphodiesterase class I)
MGMKTVAEFVETEEVAQVLKGIGIDYAQGYASGRPIPLQNYIDQYSSASSK